MIRRIFSSLPSFKSLEFRGGLNLLVAKRAPGATDRQTRNRAGKTSLVEIIHFLTGSKCDPGSIFRHAALQSHSFGMVLDVGDAVLQVSRSGETSGQVRVRFVGEQAPTWTNRVFGLSGSADLDVKEWCDLLGQQMFGLGGEPGADQVKYRPTFRAIMPYIVRRQAAHGFLSPIQAREGQLVGETQILVSWLLGLDWRIPQELQVLRDRDKELQAFKKAAGRELEQLVGQLARLRADVALVTERVGRLRTMIGEFRVLAEYEDRERELNAVTAEFSELRNANAADGALLHDLEAALVDEAPPATDDVRRVYEEARLILPDAVTRRFEEVLAFHGSVVSNRRTYLQGELEAARSRIAGRAERLGQLESRRMELMRLLKSHGALAELTELQAELGRREGELETLRRRYAAAERLETEGARLAAERRQLHLRLQQDHNERIETIQRATVLVQDATAALYDTPGRLLIEATPSGPKIAIKIEGDRSEGVGNMEIFAFDMAIMRMIRERVPGTGFLVHDSHLYDGVDGRQKAKALLIGQSASSSEGWQYIVTMNEDDLPQPEDRPEGFRPEEFILPVVLTDETETGGLFGMRFD